MIQYVIKGQTETFFKVHLKMLKPPVIGSFILRKKYIRIGRILEKAEMGRWANEKEGRLRDRGVTLDYRVSGQPGSGMYLFP